jgi:Tol biopolymer transport system component
VRAYVAATSRNGSNETALTKGAVLNDKPIWPTNGKHFLFINDQSGTLDLRSIEVT